MLQSIKDELQAHILDKISDGVLTNDNFDEHHQLCFNESYYIIGTYQCKEWLRRHGIDAFDAISLVAEYEQDNFGQVNTENLQDAEKVVNMLTYIYGQEILSEHDPDTIAELWEWMGGETEDCPLPDEEDEDDEDDEDED